MDFSVLTKADITDQEAAAIVGVSHVSIWKYRTGRALPVREEVKVRTETLLYVLGKLLEKGALPKLDLTFVKNMNPEVKARRKSVWAKVKQLVDDRVAKDQANT